MVLLAGFAGIYTMFIKVNMLVKLIAIGGFINCFFAAVPFVSFTSYISIAAAVYFYILCTRIKDWKPILKAIQAMILLNVLLGAMQFLGKDAITNFGREVSHYGMIGQHMQMASMSVILAAPALIFSPLNIFFVFLTAIFCKSSWALLCASAGTFILILFKKTELALCFLFIGVLLFAVMAVKQNKFEENLAKHGRLGVWQKTVQFMNDKPLTGWGAGSYKYIFSALDDLDDKRVYKWKTAHNCFIQAGFEFGYPGLLISIVLPIFLIYQLIQINRPGLIVGVVMISLDAMVHFPSRMIQAVLIILAFLAYCDIQIQKG
jgi:O-antigen ligase